MKKSRKSVKTEPKTAGQWIIRKVDTKDYRAGKVKGCKHFNHGSKNAANSQDNILNMTEAAGGRSNFLKQIAELQKRGIVQVVYNNVNNDVAEIIFPVDQMAALCRYEGVTDSRAVLQSAVELVERWRMTVQSSWLKEYYNYLLHQLSQGTIPENCRDENIFRILDALEKITQDTFKREFSAKVLKNSKLFEDIYEDRILTILREYSPKVRDMADSMKSTELLAEHGIITYSQMLEFKGGIIYRLDDGEEIDSSVMCYGTILNAQSLSHARLVSLCKVKKIITIENKANYESMIYEPETLYLYTHGFLSPKERRFLKQILEMADSGLSYYHWSDMDLGGIRIFQFMKKEVFPEIHPLHMDRKSFEQARAAGAGMELDPRKRQKLEETDAGELEDLKDIILKTGVEIEQENMIH